MLRTINVSGGILFKLKRGDITVKNLLGLIIAAVAVFILFMLFFKLLAPSFDIKDNTAKSYFSSLKTSIEDLEEGGVSDFSVLALPDNIDNSQVDDRLFFVVYFGDQNIVRYFVKEDFKEFSTAESGILFTGGRVDYKLYYNFFLKRFPSNTICVCSSPDSVEFDSCYGEIYSELDGKNIDAVCDFTCDDCIDLDLPVVTNVDPPAFAIGEFDLLRFRKGRDTGDQAKYFLEVIE